MSEQSNAIPTAAVQPPANDPQTRQRSTISFPYMDLGAAVTAATTLHDKAGHDQCSLQQLSAWMGTTTTSSTFRVQVGATRLFGFIDSDGPESYRLSMLGRRLVDPQQEKRAKVEAFLNVPLFNALYESHKDGVLPPTAALEREIAALGVSEKQKDRARQVFERSAELSGFFEHGKTRLVMPAFKGAGNGGESLASPPLPPTPPGSGGNNGSGDGGTTLDLDPLLIALLQKIPKSGEQWPAAQRLRWFKTFAMNVSQVYDDDASPVDLNVTLAA